MVVIEKSFPRGGVVSTKSKETKPKEDIIFGTLQKKIKKKSKTPDEEKSLNEETDTNLIPKTAELINYETVQDGMLLMGIVQSIEELFMNISLPGRMKARVSALEISNAYYKIAREFVEKTKESALYRPLNQIFSIGQIVYGRVEEISSMENGVKRIKMSLKPSEVHKDLVHTNVKKGFLFAGAIEEIQEHGYIIESGIKGLRTFLPLDKSKQSRGHAIGQLIFLKVEKVTHDKSVTTSICKEVSENNFSMKNHAEPNLDYIMPSTILQFKISQVLKNGLQGTIMNESVTAYVNEHQLTDALSLPEDYETEKVHKVRVLYVMPLTKLVYLSLNLRKNESDEGDDKEVTSPQYKRGTVIKNAKVHHLGTGGIIVILDNKYKGLISYKSIKAPVKGNYDHDELVKKYSKKTKLTVRILGHDLMDSLYICSDDPSVVNEKYFSFDDVHPGDFVNANVETRDEKTGGFHIKLGNLRGLIDKLYLMGKVTEHSKLRCRILSFNKERKSIYVTNRSEYMQKDCKILRSIEEARVNRVYMGTIVKCGPSFMLVKFFNDIQGYFPRKNAPNSTFFEGQTMLFRITEVKNERITLGLPENLFNLGEICPITIGHKLDSGLEVKIQYHMESNEENEDSEEEENESKGPQEYIGFMPLSNLSDFPDLQMAKYQALSEGSSTNAACMSKNIFSLRDVPYFQGLSLLEWQSVKTGNILRAYVKNVQDDVVELMLPLNNYDKLIKVHRKMLICAAFDNSNITLVPEQVLYVKILSKESITKTLTVSAKLVDVWDGKLKTTAAYAESYLLEVENIREALQKANSPIANYEIGQKVKANFEGIDENTKDWLYSISDDNIAGIVRTSIVRKANPPKKGHQQECIVLWIDYSNNIIYLSNKFCDISHIHSTKSLPENLINKSGMNAKVLLKLENLVLLSMKKPGNPIVYCPMRLHYNDLENSIGINLIEGEFCKIAFIHDQLPIAVTENIWKLWKDDHRKRPAEALEEKPAKKLKIFDDSINEEEQAPLKIGLKTNKTGNLKKKVELAAPQIVSKKPRKTSETEDVKLPQNAEKVKLQKQKPKTQVKSETLLNNFKAESDNDDDHEEANVLSFFEDKKPSSSSALLSEKPKPKPKVQEKLIGINDFWSSTLNDNSADAASSSSSEDDEDQDLSKTDTKKRKKPTAAEKFKQNREAENRLREIEEKYADPNAVPETIDQFERLVISEPNNSKNWINFMVHHLQAAEIEKAKAVARRAIKTISFRQTEDLLNIWAALLNLDLRYGNKDDFDETLKEALTCNDPIKVHLRAVEILCNAKKNQELIELLNIITKKYKANPEVWRAVANAYFQINMPEKAQQMLHRALACLPERDHVNTIVSFANLNHKYDQKDMAQTLFDQVITSYPKRVDVWTQYADVLIKDDLLDQARALMERATLDKIPVKKMRTIFKKMLEIEQRFGSEEDVEKVKHKAAEYVKAHSV